MSNQIIINNRLAFLNIKPNFVNCPNCDIKIYAKDNWDDRMNKNKNMSVRTKCIGCDIKFYVTSDMRGKYVTYT